MSNNKQWFALNKIDWQYEPMKGDDKQVPIYINHNINDYYEHQH